MDVPILSDTRIFAFTLGIGAWCPGKMAKAKLPLGLLLFCEKDVTNRNEILTCAYSIVEQLESSLCLGSTGTGDGEPC